MNDLRCGRAQPPSWYANVERREEFLHGIQTMSRRNEVPDEYYQEVLSKEVNYVRLFNYAGAMEVRKASFIEQQLAISNLILEWHIRQVRIDRMIEMNWHDG